MEHVSLIEQREQMEHNLTNHSPKDQFVVLNMEVLREEAKRFGSEILRRTPSSREQSLALTNLEQTLMWAVAAIARHQED